MHLFFVLLDVFDVWQNPNQNACWNLAPVVGILKMGSLKK